MDNLFMFLTKDPQHWGVVGILWLLITAVTTLAVAGYRIKDAYIGNLVLIAFACFFGLFDQSRMSSSVDGNELLPMMTSLAVGQLLPVGLSLLTCWLADRYLFQHQVSTNPELREKVQRLHQQEQALKGVKKAPYTDELNQKATKLETSIRELREEIEQLRIRIFNPDYMARKQMNESYAQAHRQQQADAALKLANRALETADAPPDLPVVAENSTGVITDLPLAADTPESQQLRVSA